MIRMVLKIIVWIIRHSVPIVLFFIPWVFKALIFMLMLVATAVGSLWAGIPNTMKIMADEWVQRAIKAGFPPAWEKQLQCGVSVLAFLTLIAGWTVLAFTAIFIVRSMF